VIRERHQRHTSRRAAPRPPLGAIRRWNSQPDREKVVRHALRRTALPPLTAGACILNPWVGQCETGSDTYPRPKRRTPARTEATAIADFGYETGTSSDRFTVSEGVPPPSRFSLISRQFGPGGGSGWLDRSARKCPRVDARDWLLFTVEARVRSTVSSRRIASTVQTTRGSRLSQTCSRR
jgi:hypothetical protein